MGTKNLVNQNQIDEIENLFQKASKLKLTKEGKREQRIRYAMSCVGDYSTEGRKMAEKAVDRLYG